MLRYFDFRCTGCGETTEELIPNDTKKINCPECGAVAVRQLAAPRIDWKKMGLDPGFTSSQDKWAKAKRKHSQDGGRKGLSEGGATLLMH